MKDANNQFSELTFNLKMMVNLTCQNSSHLISFYYN